MAKVPDQDPVQTRPERCAPSSAYACAGGALTGVFTTRIPRLRAPHRSGRELGIPVRDKELHGGRRSPSAMGRVWGCWVTPFPVGGGLTPPSPAKPLIPCLGRSPQIPREPN